MSHFILFLTHTSSHDLKHHHTLSGPILLASLFCCIHVPLLILLLYKLHSSTDSTYVVLQANGETSPHLFTSLCNCLYTTFSYPPYCHTYICASSLYLYSIFFPASFISSLSIPCEGYCLYYILFVATGSVDVLLLLYFPIKLSCKVLST